MDLVVVHLSGLHADTELTISNLLCFEGFGFPHTDASSEANVYQLGILTLTLGLANPGIKGSISYGHSLSGRAVEVYRSCNVLTVS